ncbi:MAG: ribonuclease E/G [Lachnospiraceae bacterium]|nr:ribonuclease E/G [Lachnospiraceae bacterium]MBP3609143.1 ribonuclease E/G [Lachnospiraceae bacterium]
MSELVITNYKNSIISAVYDNKEMVQVTACRKKTTAGIGNIYVGRIDNIVKNINAAFVNISEQLSCYLDLSGIKQPLFVKKQSEKKISIGDELLVQIVKEDVKTKAPVVTTNISLTGKYIVLVHGGEGIQISKKIQQKAVRNSFKPMLEGMVREQTGIVVRTNAQYVSREEIEREAALLFEEYDQILKTGVHQTKYSLVHQELPQYLQQLRDSREAAMDKVVTNIPAVYREFESYLKKYPVKTAEGQSLKLELAEDANDLVIRYRINHFMDKALHRMLYLKSGATIVIDPTEALTVIDVNTGKAVSGKKPTEETFFAINKEAAKEIAAQIRLRNLSGIILIDFINLSDQEKKEALMEELRQYFRQDPVQTEVVDITKLGLVELTRKKVYKTLAEQLAEVQ